MKNTQDFLNMKNAMLGEGMTKEQVYDTLNRMLRKYNAEIAEADFLHKERILKSERFSLFCVIQSFKEDMNPSLKVHYTKNEQIKIVA